MLFLKISEFCMLLQPSLETVTAIPTVLYTEEMQFLYYRTSNKDECFNLKICVYPSTVFRVVEYLVV